MGYNNCFGLSDSDFFILRIKGMLQQKFLTKAVGLGTLVETGNLGVGPYDR
jgi:hypothetical protein